MAYSDFVNKRLEQWVAAKWVQGDLVAADCSQMLRRMERLEEIETAATFVFKQLQDIAQGEGPPIVQDWGRIDRLGVALFALHGEGK